MNKSQATMMRALKVVALAMAVVSGVLSSLAVTPVEVNIMLLGVGLFAISVASLMQTKG